MENNFETFIQKNSPDGGFLQSEKWRKFQENVGRKTYNIVGDNFNASVIEHRLSIVGSYFYIPRGPVFEMKNVNLKMQNDIAKCKIFLNQLINLAKNNNAGWVRIEPATEEILNTVKDAVGVRFIEPKTTGFNKLNPYKSRKYVIQKAPHDMQPREIFAIDISNTEEELLKEMKSKTRYNIRLAGKKGVNAVESSKYKVLSKKELGNEFLRLTRIMAKRQGIAVHPDEYYRKMFETISGDILKLYVAEYKNKIIAANLVVFYGNTATYLHGASDDAYKNLMAPYLLQWKQIQDAKKAGCEKYDFGGISTNYESNTNIRITNKWQGITRFKLGFSPNTEPIEFPGSYDIIINKKKYLLYRILQRVKNIF